VREGNPGWVRYKKSTVRKTCEKVGFEPRVKTEGVKEGRNDDDVHELP